MTFIANVHYSSRAQGQYKLSSSTQIMCVRDLLKRKWVLFLFGISKWNLLTEFARSKKREYPRDVWIGSLSEIVCIEHRLESGGGFLCWFGILWSDLWWRYFVLSVGVDITLTQQTRTLLRWQRLLLMWGYLSRDETEWLWLVTYFTYHRDERVWWERCKWAMHGH